MAIKLIGMKQFRQNLAFYTKEAQKKGTCFIVLKKNVPVIKIEPVDEKEFALEKLKEEIREAEEQVKRGEVYTHEEVLEKLGLL